MEIAFLSCVKGGASFNMQQKGFIRANQDLIKKNYNTYKNCKIFLTSRIFCCKFYYTLLKKSYNEIKFSEN